jgi:hypothetical protein
MSYQQMGLYGPLTGIALPSTRTFAALCRPDKGGSISTYYTITKEEVDVPIVMVQAIVNGNVPKCGSTSDRMQISVTTLSSLVYT